MNNSLEELDMGHNPIGDDGMSTVAVGLLCKNTLKKLNVLKCGFSVKGTVVYRKIIWLLYRWNFLGMNF